MQVLILGYRKQITETLERLSIPFVVWSDKPLKKVPATAAQVVIHPYQNNRADLARFLAEHPLVMKPTHVIAGTEAAVFPAAIIRRVFSSRRSPDTLLIRCTDKAAMKTYLSKHDVPMTKFIEHRKDLRAAELVSQLGLPVVVKDRINSGGRNLTIARTVEELEGRLSRERIYERFVDAPEGSIESWIQDGRIIFKSVTDYRVKRFANVVPAPYPKDVLESIDALNQQVITALKIKWGMTHLEFYLTADGVLLGEIALRPPGGYIMDLIKIAYGVDSWELSVKVELGLDVSSISISEQRYAGCYLLHPGEGIVESVAKPDAKEFPTLTKCKIRVCPGDKISLRIGAGDDVGVCTFTAKESQQVLQDVDRMVDRPVLLITAGSDE